jgi:O-antigen/teichoic acid export membrane protein
MMWGPGPRAVEARVTPGLRPVAGIGAMTALLKVATAAWGIAVARYLGPLDYGRFAFVLAIIVASQVFSDSGASSYLARHTARRRRAGNTVALVAVLRLQLLLSVSAGLLAGVATLIVTRGGIVSGCGVVVVVISTALAQVPRGVLRGTGRVVLETGLQLGGYALLLATTFVLRNSLTPSIAVWAYSLWSLPILVYGFSKLGMGHAVRAAISGSPRERSIIRRAFVVTWPFNGISSLGALWTRLDVLVLGTLVGSVALGNYSAALQLYMGAISVAVAVAMAFIPALVRNVRAQPESAGALHPLVLTFLGIGALAAIAVALASNWMDLLFGPGFELSVQVVRIMATAIPAAFASAILGQALIAMGKERRSVQVLLGVVCLGAVTHVVAGMNWGVKGVAVSLAVVVWLRFAIECRLAYGAPTRRSARASEPEPVTQGAGGGGEGR